MNPNLATAHTQPPRHRHQPPETLATVTARNPRATALQQRTAQPVYPGGFRQHSPELLMHGRRCDNRQPPALRNAPPPPPRTVTAALRPPGSALASARPVLPSATAASCSALISRSTAACCPAFRSLPPVISTCTSTPDRVATGTAPPTLPPSAAAYRARVASNRTTTWLEVPGRNLARMLLPGPPRADGVCSCLTRRTPAFPGSSAAMCPGKQG